MKLGLAKMNRVGWSSPKEGMGPELTMLKLAKLHQVKMPKTKKLRDLSEIDPYATCISLEIPQMFSCSVCYDKYKNVLAHTRKKRKEERCKSERNK